MALVGVFGALRGQRKEMAPGGNHLAISFLLQDGGKLHRWFRTDHDLGRPVTYPLDIPIAQSHPWVVGTDPDIDYVFVLRRPEH